MALYCIPVEFVAKLKAAAKSGEISIEKLYEMNSKDRRGLFSNYTHKELGQFINEQFERAMVSRQKDVMKNWVANTFTAKQKESVPYTDILEKIEQLEETGVLTEEGDAFLEDLAAQKLGLTLSGTEVGEITKRAQKIQALARELGSLGDPSIKPEKQLEYFELLDEMNAYIQSLSPSSNLAVASSIVGRGNLLFRISSPTLNIISNTFWGSYQAIERRLNSGAIGGLNRKFAKQYATFVNRVYQKSGFDMSRMLSLADTQKTLGEERLSSEGKGTVRKAGRFYEDTVFKQLMGAPDVLGASIAFADSANIESTLIATREEGLTGEVAQRRALVIFKDAVRVEPTTIEGQMVREKAIADAQVATFTDKNGWSEFALKIRETLNKVGNGDMRLGDQLMPFVKTPANIVSASVDVSGILTIPGFFIRGAKMIADVVGKKATWSEARMENFRGFQKKAIRAGFGFLLAFLISAGIDDDDYIGEFDIKERELNKIKNSVNNAVRVGDRWVSLDYFGPLAAPLVGIMYARKYGKSLPRTAFEYYLGVGTQAVKLPGIEASKDATEALINVTTRRTDVADLPMAVAQSSLDFFRSRLVPGIVSDFAKMTDDYERKTKGQGVFAKFKASIPFLREDLPVAKDTLGNQIRTQPAFSQLFFGSRVKVAQDSRIIEELDRLNTTGNLPTLTYIEETSTRFPRLLEQKGEEKYQEAVDNFYKKFSEKLDKEIQSREYKKLSDEEKKDAINKLKGEVLDDVLKRAGYKEKKKTK